MAKTQYHQSIISAAAQQYNAPLTNLQVQPNALNRAAQIQKDVTEASSAGYNLDELKAYLQYREDQKALATAERLATGSKALEASIEAGLITDKSKEELMTKYIEDTNAARIAKAEKEAKQREQIALSNQLRAEEEKSKSNLWIGLTVVGLAAIGGLSWYYMKNKSKSRKNALELDDIDDDFDIDDELEE
jgi:hypothetical protein